MCDCARPAAFGRTYTTSFDMDHSHTVEIPHSAFGAVSPKFRRNVHMMSEAFGVTVAAPMVWWGANQVQDARARYALKALAVAMATVDGALLASYGRDIYRARQR